MTLVYLDNAHTDINVGSGGSATYLSCAIPLIFTAVDVFIENLDPNVIYNPFGGPYHNFQVPLLATTRFRTGGPTGPLTKLGTRVSLAPASFPHVGAFDGTADFAGTDTGMIGEQAWAREFVSANAQILIPNTGFTLLYCERALVLLGATYGGVPLSNVQLQAVGGSNLQIEYHWI